MANDPKRAEKTEVSADGDKPRRPSDWEWDATTGRDEPADVLLRAEQLRMR